MIRHAESPMSREKMWVRIALVAVGLVVLLVGLSYRRLEGQAPSIAFDGDFEVLGRGADLELTVEDVGTGLKQVRVVFTQGDMAFVLAEESFDEPVTTPRTYDLGALITERYNVQDGPASLAITASDDSYRDFLAGNRIELTRDFRFDLYPPRLETVSDLIYMNQGGSDCVLYRVSEDAVVSGVQVGPHFFPGFAVDPSDPDLRFALFAFAYNLPADTPVRLLARDGAGNEALADVSHRLAARVFRSREIVLTDSFLQKVVPEIASRTPGVVDQGTLIDTYVEINSNLRRTNHETIAELSKQSEGQFLWDGAFNQLSNSQVESFFADGRTYMYEGEAVDQQDHVGFDLSVVQRYPIEAANAGQVILADYFGIYGNTVLIDHGAGLVSLYAHMSSLDVSPGQMVAKEAILGRSGATGLAGGDHLHFGLFLHGVPVNPIEWWDPKWVQEHVLDRLEPAVAGE
jgi:murein DD-endopeptidase MepM/ murein hydrolase activator NlpD